MFGSNKKIEELERQVKDLKDDIAEIKNLLTGNKSETKKKSSRGLKKTTKKKAKKKTKKCCGSRKSQRSSSSDVYDMGGSGWC